MAKKLSL